MDEDETEPGVVERELVMPFVIVESAGGPYEDDAFVAGYTCGALDEELRALCTVRATPRGRMIRDAHMPQADLIAMRYGYKTLSGELDEASGWRHVEFEFIGVAP